MLIVRACKNNEEPLKLAKEDGIALSGGELDKIAGGEFNWLDIIFS